jgi:polyisoprenyl-teichoic acid--peptidoglycan teichoic acid transferase
MSDTELSESEARARLQRLDDPVDFVVTSDLVTAARARGGHLRRRRRTRRALIAIPLVALVVVAGAAVWVAHRADQVHRVDVATGVLAPVEGGQPFDVLVVGTDGPRGQAGVHTDTIMVVRVDQAADQVRILSIPRDLVFDGTGPKLDTLLSQGGASALIRAVEQHLGIPIAHFVEIDPTGLAALVDQVGGVSVDVNTRVQDAQTGLDLAPGCHTLDGQAALALARSRRLRVQDPDGQWTDLAGADLQREADQQALVAIIGHRLLTLSPNPTSLPTWLDVFADHTTVDTQLSLAELTSLASWASGLSANDLSTATLPVTPLVRADGDDALIPQPAVEMPVSSLPFTGAARGVTAFLAPPASDRSGGGPPGVGGSTTTTASPGASTVFIPCG